MAMAKSMRDLTQDIRSTADQRKEDITNLKEGTASLRQDAGEMVQDFHDSRKKSGEQLRRELTQGSKQLAIDEKKRRQEVGKMIGGFQSSRQKAGAKLQKELAEGQARLKSDVNETLSEARNLIGEFQTSRRQMASELKTELEKSRDARNADVTTMRDGFRQVHQEVRDDLKGAADAWKEMGAALPKTTVHGKPAKKAAVVTPPNLEEQLLTIINQHSEGITLSDVAKEIGIVTIVLGKAAKELLDQNKVRKEGKLYFPVIR